MGHKFKIVWRANYTFRHICIVSCTKVMQRNLVNTTNGMAFYCVSLIQDAR